MGGCAHTNARAVDVFLWSVPAATEKAVQGLLQGAMADALQRQQIQRVNDSTVEILSTAAMGTASVFGLGSQPGAEGSNERIDSDSSQGSLSSAIVISERGATWLLGQFGL